VSQIGHWGPGRWIAGNRRASVFALVQELADLLAAAEQRPSRPVPRLENDLALPDQFQVMVDDLLSASLPPEILDTATDAIATTRDAFTPAP
jgi:hypothetical protein